MSGNWGRVAISTRLFEGPHPDFVNCLAALLAGGLRPGDVWLAAPVRKAAHHGANRIARAFLASDCDSLLMLDDDQTFAPDSLERLRSDPAGAEYDILMGLIVGRGTGRPSVLRLVPGCDPCAPYFQFVTEWEDGAIVPVDQAGLGFTLIRREVFDVCPPPWFHYLAYEVAEDLEATEDLPFCRAARDAGFRIGVHTGIKVGHLTTGCLSVTRTA